MYRVFKFKRKYCIRALIIIAVAALIIPAVQVSAKPKKDFIKWVDFNVPQSLMEEAMKIDIDTKEEAVHVDWIHILAYLGAKYGGDFSLYKSADLNALMDALNSGRTIEDITGNMKYFGYYNESYRAVLGGMIGEYEVETEGGTEKRYGLKAFFPIAKTFPYNDYDDFGVGRSYGYKRRHLGHDLMAETGTPVIAIESGVVETMGWNQYGGWRVGIRSFDGKRYHYYAHLRKDRPYAEGLEEGKTVMAGEVIGYVGRTGYSATENTNNIDTSHLHYGLQLIFDESQKEGPSEIWVDVYGICSLLRRNQSETVRNDETKEWTAVQPYRETIPENCFTP